MSKRVPLSVSLTTELAAFVAEKVGSGRYGSASEVVRAALFNSHVHVHIFRLMFHSRVTQEALEEHEALLSAFRAGDGPAAREAMLSHITRSRDRLILAFD